METKVLVMGKERNYHEADVTRQNLQKKIREMAKRGNSFSEDNAEELLYSLRTKNSIPAKQLRSYGGAITFEENTTRSETAIDGLERFFKRAFYYAGSHNSRYVLVQDLKLNHPPMCDFEIKGLVQLLIE